MKIDNLQLKVTDILRTLFTFETASSTFSRNKAAKVKTTLLVLMSDFMIISFQKKDSILIVHNCYEVIMSN